MAISGILQDHLKQGNDAVSTLKSLCTDRKNEMAVANVDRTRLVGLRLRLKKHKQTLTGVAAINGIQDYAKEQKADSQYDLATFYASIATAIDACLTQINGDFPMFDSGGKTWLKLYFVENGDVLEDVFTPSQTAAIREKLTDVISAIE